mmetsp:Transcript_6137/g.15211  ORF Transcript_6137/g.15211 Transcript_6137/m.15211 type:complete len:374 (+) Transcript_6137:1845-2966(+)
MPRYQPPFSLSRPSVPSPVLPLPLLPLCPSPACGGSVPPFPRAPPAAVRPETGRCPSPAEPRPSRPPPRLPLLAPVLFALPAACGAPPMSGSAPRPSPLLAVCCSAPAPAPPAAPTPVARGPPSPTSSPRAGSRTRSAVRPPRPPAPRCSASSCRFRGYCRPAAAPGGRGTRPACEAPHCAAPAARPPFRAPSFPPARPQPARPARGCCASRPQPRPLWPLLVLQTAAAFRVSVSAWRSIPAGKPRPSARPGCPFPHEERQLLPPCCALHQPTWRAPTPTHGFSARTAPRSLLEACRPSCLPFVLPRRVSEPVLRRAQTPSPEVVQFARPAFSAALPSSWCAPPPTRVRAGFSCWRFHRTPIALFASGPPLPW